MSASLRLPMAYVLHFFIAPFGAIVAGLRQGPCSFARNLPQGCGAVEEALRARQQFA
jgi:hypothetical protein